MPANQAHANRLKGARANYSFHDAERKSEVYAERVDGDPVKNPAGKADFVAHPKLGAFKWRPGIDVKPDPAASARSAGAARARSWDTKAKGQ